MNDEQYMQRALELATLGLGKVSPNPMVGCLIVHNDRIIGEGYHQLCGGPHAEVNAIAAVEDKALLPASTVYVTLEPCSHHGKTPPCADLLVRHQVKKVIVCNDDPNPLVAGKGLIRMRNAGIQVKVGLLATEGRILNRRFFTSFEKKRPYVILKWAQTADGFVARMNFDSKWISNPYSRQLVHKWRSEEDAILVGKNTAHYDNPSLTTRDWHGKDPIRVVIDPHLQLDKSLNLFDHQVSTLCFSTQEAENIENLTYFKSEQITPESILNRLHQERIQSVIVEGGAKTLQAFIDAGLWDEARVFTSETTFEEGISAPGLHGELIGRQDVLKDQLNIYRNNG